MTDNIVPTEEKLLAHLPEPAAAEGLSVTPYVIYQSIPSNIPNGLRLNGGSALDPKREDGQIMIVYNSL
ncbi:hypothetical protein L209DRAFT_748038 [Thermothelomyces heterothallicus CBS 203.75]